MELNREVNELFEAKAREIRDITHAVSLIATFPGIVRNPELEEQRGSEEELREVMKDCVKEWGTQLQAYLRSIVLVRKNMDTARFISIEEIQNNPFVKLFTGVTVSDYGFRIVPYETDKSLLYMTKIPNYENFDDADIGAAIIEAGTTVPAIATDVLYKFIVNGPEMLSAETPIKNCTGNVLIYGLGIGYAAYMMHLKDDVKKITIVEKDKRLIKFFKKHILSRFEHQEKIEIIKDDYLNHAGNLETDAYDSIFVDVCSNTDNIDLFWRMYHFVQGEAKYVYCNLEDLFVLNAESVIFNTLCLLSAPTSEELQQDVVLSRTMEYLQTMKGDAFKDKSEEEVNALGCWYLRRVFDKENIKKYY